MASFASVEDLEAFLAVTFNEAEETAQAQALLDAATAEIQDYLGQTIVTPAASQTATLDPAGRFMLRLPVRPVTAVDSVVNNGVTLTVATDVVWYPDGRIYRADGLQWGTKRRSVVVDFHAGYATLPQTLVDLCRERAARRMANPVDLKAESAGAVREDYAPTGFTPDEEAILLGIRGVTVG